MKPFASCAAALTIALSLVPAQQPVQAATTSVQKCRSADGSIGYTDGSCRIFGTDAVAISSRILDTPAADAYAALDPREAPAMDSAIDIAPGRRSPADGCARTPTQLAMDLHASLALGDVNRVAESYHWTGMSSDAAERTMDRLQSLIGRPVLDSHYLDASFGIAGDGILGGAVTASAAPGAGDAGAGMLQLVLGGSNAAGASTIDFDVHRNAGCYFVSF